MSEEELKAFRNLNTFSTKYIVNKKASSENDIATMFIYIAKLEVELEHKDKEIERLHSIIKEVREYIEDNACYSDGHCKCSFSQMALDNVLNMLKGSDKE